MSRSLDSEELFDYSIIDCFTPSCLRHLPEILNQEGFVRSYELFILGSLLSTQTALYVNM